MDPSSTLRRQAEDDEIGSGLGRLLAFSDGVFAVAITLLVLNLSVRSGLSESALNHALNKLLPQIFSAATSFVVVGLFWLAHHRVFLQIKRWDRALLRLNLLSLAPIVFIPFATQLLGEYGHFQSSVIIYASTVAVAGLLFTVLWLYAATGDRLVSSAVTRRRVVAHALRSGSLAVVFGASILVALASPRAAENMWLVVVVPLVLLRLPAVDA
jgi:uncharacterized membrane protein